MNTSVYERSPDLSAATVRGTASAAAGGTVESSASAVSWAAIIAGAFVAASVSIILVALGSGLGFASVSPWAGSGTSVTAFALSTGIWLIVVQWLASAFGGYVTGRLRTKWVNVHTHEVFFRDTAHGFVTWALATVIVTVVVASIGSAAAGAGSRAVATVASGSIQASSASREAAGAPSGTSATGESAVSGYDVDLLFRTDRPAEGASAAETRGEASRILLRAATNQEVTAADRAYLAQLVAARTGIPVADAQMRVDDAISHVKSARTKVLQAADSARKAAAAASFFTALSLVIGAFIASVAAALGGRERDEHP